MVLFLFNINHKNKKMSASCEIPTYHGPSCLDLSTRPNVVKMTPNHRDDLAEIFADTDGMITEHNFPCPVCHSTQAVLNTVSGEFCPCWECQNKKWITLQIKSRFVRWLLRI